MRHASFWAFSCGVVFFGFCVAGCVSTIEDPVANYHQTGRAQIKNGPMHLPPYVNEGNYRKLVLGVEFGDIIGIRDGKNDEEMTQIMKGLSTRLQTDMAKLKRFSIVSLHNRSATKTIKALGEVGEVATEQTPPPPVDLALSGTLTAMRTRFSGYSKDRLEFTVECDFNCENLSNKGRDPNDPDAIDQAGTVKFAEKSVGKIAKVAYYNSNYELIGGHRPADDLTAAYQAALIALADLANKLGNRYPVGGKITGILGDRMTLDIGSEHGIGANQQVVVYIKKSNIKLPLAYAEASPDPKSSNLVVWRWNTDDKIAKSIIKEMGNDSDWLAKHKDELWAVGYGMAIPPEWEDPYKK